jgi:hypothetical protein
MKLKRQKIKEKFAAKQKTIKIITKLPQFESLREMKKTFF